MYNTLFYQGIPLTAVFSDHIMSVDEIIEFKEINLDDISENLDIDDLYVEVE